MRMAREVVTRAIDTDEFLGQAARFMRERPEITHMSWITAKRQRKASHSAILFHAEASPNGEALDPSLPVDGRRSAAEAAFVAARDLRQPVYSRAFNDAGGRAGVPGHVPLIDRSAFSGTLVAEYSVEAMRALLRAAGGWRSATRITVLDGAREVASTRDADARRDRPPRADRARRAARARRQRPACCAARAGARRSASSATRCSGWWWRCRASRCGCCWAPGATCAGAGRSRRPSCPRPTSGARWKTPCSPACAPSTSKAASATSTPPSAR